MKKCTTALLSVSNKAGIVDFASGLADLGVSLLSTGGTARDLRAAGLAATDVSDVTGHPEIMDGRVKTLHPRIHGGLLGRGEQDAAVMAEHGIRPIELLVVNLYPFEATIAKPGCSREEAIENIDIGGPAMLRAAAKNHEHVAVVVDPQDYLSVLDEIRSTSTISEATRRRLALKAFSHTACYDAAISEYLRSQESDDALPYQLPVGLRLESELRYGENPHQRAGLYRTTQTPSGSLIDAQQHQGKSLSYNNLADADAALECAKRFDELACVIVKHANPCGVGLGDDLLAAYDRAYRTDPTSAFGGIIACNRKVDAALVDEILARQFLEVMIAPSYTKGALQAFAAKPNIRVLETGPLSATMPGLRLQAIEGAMLVQDKDLATLDPAELEVVTERQPSEQERADALLAWRVARFVKSNAIVYCRDRMTLGIGAGQMSRVVSARIAAMKAAEAELDLTGAAMASDAFFPFRDGIDTAAERGIAVVIQPGGSMRDQEVIDAANEHGLAMLFTGMRHFRH